MIFNIVYFYQYPCYDKGRGGDPFQKWIVDAHTIPLKADLSPKVYAPIPPKHNQSLTYISTGSYMFLVNTSISYVVIPFNLTS